VFGAGWPVTMVGLDVTHKINMTRDHLDAYAYADNPMAKHIARIVPFYRHFFESRNHINGIFVHDSTAIAYVINPALFETQQWPVRVETQGISRGKTWPAVGDTERATAWQNRPKVNVCVEVDAVKAIELELKRLTA
jgi:inosine-uridine nucleoside N-ribohydrolase